MKKKFVDLGGGGWDSVLFDSDTCEYIPYDVYEVSYDDDKGEDVRIEFNNAKEAYKFYKTIKASKVMWGYLKSGYNDLLEHHDYE